MACALCLFEAKTASQTCSLSLVFLLCCAVYVFVVPVNREAWWENRRVNTTLLFNNVTGSNDRGVSGEFEV